MKREKSNGSDPDREPEADQVALDDEPQPPRSTFYPRYGINAGFVEEILKKAKPIIQYDRTGGLYVTEMTLSSFTWQGHHE